MANSSPLDNATGFAGCDDSAILLAMSPPNDRDARLAALEWQIELGATEAIGERPVNRYTEDQPAAQPDPPSADPPPADPDDPIAAARTAAAGARDLAGLHRALAAFDLCELKRGAHNCVFSDGDPAARVMIIGEAPGRDEDKQGKPFVGRAGRLLDKMFVEIGLARAEAAPGHELYITNILPWRPPQNRDPKPDEIAMMLPFMERHIALAAPEILVLTGNISCSALLGRKGITKLRGTWTEATGRPTLPMVHPAYLLRNPHAKREAWHDLLMLQAKLREAG